MANKVDVDNMTGEHAHSHKVTSWVTVGLIVLSSVILGFAFVLQSIPLAVLGFVVGIAGLITGYVGRIFDDAF